MLKDLALLGERGRGGGGGGGPLSRFLRKCDETGFWAFESAIVTCHIFRVTISLCFALNSIPCLSCFADYRGGGGGVYAYVLSFSDSMTDVFFGTLADSDGHWRTQTDSCCNREAMN